MNFSCLSSLMPTFIFHFLDPTIGKFFSSRANQKQGDVCVLARVLCRGRVCVGAFVEGVCVRARACVGGCEGFLGRERVSGRVFVGESVCRRECVRGACVRGVGVRGRGRLRARSCVRECV